MIDSDKFRYGAAFYQLVHLATLAGIGEVVWTGINLCGTKAVILNRNGSGVLWVDYE